MNCDLKIKSEVRGVLARHRVDLQSIRIGCFNGVVRIVGLLQFLTVRSSDRLAGAAVDAIEYETRRIRDVRSVFLDLENWIRGSEGWTLLAEQRR
jgi:hypothetical protein